MTDDPPKLHPAPHDDPSRLDMGLVDAVGITVAFVLVIGFGLFVQWVLS